jgi:hypothetical protein
VKRVSEQVDYAIRQFLHKQFVMRDGRTRAGATFRLADRADLPGMELTVHECVRKYANPSDDVYLVQTETGARSVIRMEVLRNFYEESKERNHEKSLKCVNPLSKPGTFGSAHFA